MAVLAIKNSSAFNVKHDKGHQDAAVAGRKSRSGVILNKRDGRWRRAPAAGFHQRLKPNGGCDDPKQMG